MSNGPESSEWEQGWSGHEVQQLRRRSRLPLIEALRWLEDAHHLVLHLSSTASSRHEPDYDAMYKRSRRGKAEG